MPLKTNTQHCRSQWKPCFKALARFSRGRNGRRNNDRQLRSTWGTPLSECVCVLRRTTDVPLSTAHRLGGAQGGASKRFALFGAQQPRGQSKQRLKAA